MVFAGLQAYNLLFMVVYCPPRGRRPNHPMTTLSYSWVPRDTLEIDWNVNACTVTQKITKLVPQGLPKWPKWDQNKYLKSLKSARNKKVKSNENTTIYYTFEGLGLHESLNQQVFHSKVIPNHACDSNMICDASREPRYQKGIQNGLQGETRKSSKNYENPSWDLPGSICVHVWPIWL